MTPLQIAIGGLALMVGLLALAQRLGGWQNRPLARCLGIAAAGCIVAWCFLLFPAWCGWISAAVIGSICLRFITTWLRKPIASTEQNPADNERLSTWSQISAFWSSLSGPDIGFGLVMACLLGWVVWIFVDVSRNLNFPSKPTPSFDVQMVLADGRIVISSSVEDLQTAFRNSTMDHFNRLLGDKWMKLSGKIEDNLGGGTIMIETRGSPTIVLHFAKGWEEQLSVLPRDSSVTIRGKIALRNVTWITLEECELL